MYPVSKSQFSALKPYADSEGIDFVKNNYHLDSSSLDRNDPAIR